MFAEKVFGFLTPRVIGGLIAAGIGGFAVWKYVAAWELQQLLTEAQSAAKTVSTAVTTAAAKV
jgi:hypothetical protein